MRLPRPFYRLPVRFDAARLQVELEALPDSAWARHPKEFTGNASIRLISVDGARERHACVARCVPTQHLQACPYVRQVLASFGVVWSRSQVHAARRRLQACPSTRTRATTGFNRVRMHIPVVTLARSQVHLRRRKRAHGGGRGLGVRQLAPSFRRQPDRPGGRVHLVADTVGNSRFWQFVARQRHGVAGPRYCRTDRNSMRAC